LYRTDNRPIAGAAAEIAVQPFSYVVLVQRPTGGEQLGRSQQHAGCAEAALCGAMCEKRLL
jgi:hypothetical protein